MTDLLVRLFVRGADNPESVDTRAAVGALSGAVGIVCNLVLFALKLAAGIFTASVAITADAMNNLTDATGSVVTYVGFRLALRPADDAHPFGHARYEYLSGLAVAVLIMLIGFELGKSSLEKIIHPGQVAFSFTAALVLLCAIALKLWLSRFNSRLSRMIRSTALAAAAADSRNDCIATASVLVSGLVGSVTRLQPDGWIGLGVAVFILYSGWKLARQTISPLLGEAADPALQEQLAAHIAASPKILGFHDLMVHDYGPGQRFATLHVEMDRREDPLACHAIIDTLERQCLKEYGIHLVIHYDPVETNDPQQQRLRAVVEAILRMRDARIEIHDFRVERKEQGLHLVFDAQLPGELRGEEKGIRRSLETALNGLGEGAFSTEITFDTAHG